jgi:glutamyl-tRNA reductase
MHRLMLTGLNHTTAPLELREKLVFSGEQRAAALSAFRSRFPQAEAVLLSTCNRVELYTARTVHGHPRAEEMIDFLAGFHGLDPRALAGRCYTRVDRQTVAHLFNVASSLDSMVVGETQILGQVREAYEVARRSATAGALLNPLFQRAIAVGKEVMSSTPLSEGRLSVASVAVEFAGQIFDHYEDKTVLAIGAGKMARLVLQSFHALRPRRLLVCNRDGEKARQLAARFAGEAVAFDRLTEHLGTADIVISSTGSTRPIITRGPFEQALRHRRYRPVFLIDIALPRDVEPSVGELPNVYLYNIDDLQRAVEQTHSRRAEAIEQARAIVERHVEEFAAWQRARAMGPLIDRLYRRSQQMALEEAQRAANRLRLEDAAQRQQLEELARRIVNKLLHEPVRTLRDVDPLSGSAMQYLSAVERLFGLAEGGADSEAAAGADAAPPANWAGPRMEADGADPAQGAGRGGCTDGSEARSS